MGRKTLGGLKPTTAGKKQKKHYKQLPNDREFTSIALQQCYDSLQSLPFVTFDDYDAAFGEVPMFYHMYSCPESTCDFKTNIRKAMYEHMNCAHIMAPMFQCAKCAEHGISFITYARRNVSHFDERPRDGKYYTCTLKDRHLLSEK